jgi:prepilin-type N-terminal cleavage/methylation domain-containing protein/prepilin-type processing-associated H-X9-DG protein
MKPGPSRGFTLIELLVVIAIIAVLAAILFPVFAGVREKGRATTCLSNLKQLGTAVQMYTQDWEGAYPQAWVFGLDYGWDVLIFQYVKNYQVYECPSNKVTPRYWAGYKAHGLGPIPGSYAMTDDVAFRPEGIPGQSDRAGVREATVTNPAETILMSEIRDNRSNDPAGTFEGHKAGPYPVVYTFDKNTICDLLPLGIHHRGTNYTFCDGHAKWLQVEQTWTKWRTDGTELKGSSTLCDKRLGR